MSNSISDDTTKATIVIDVFEGHFKVKVNGFISVSDFYNTIASLLIHLEENTDEIVDNSMTTMLQ